MSKSKPWKTTVDIVTHRYEKLRITLAVTIDWNAIAKELAHDAQRNKSKKTRMCNGSIVAIVLKEEPRS